MQNNNKEGDKKSAGVLNSINHINQSAAYVISV